MKILHIAAHLGGGVGRVHSELSVATASEVDRHYVLLEAPRDRRFVDRIEASRKRFTIAPDFETISRLASEADIVQVEWWNHPRLFECLCRAALPPMRTVFWSHVSGLHAPYIPSGLFAAADSFLLTSACSLEAPNIAALPDEIRNCIDVANSGFGFARTREVSPRGQSALPIAYLGTVNFSKMSPEFFDVVDSVEGLDFTVSIWGAADPADDVAHRAAAMRLPERVCFKGQVANPESILGEAGIFLYLLQPHHFGTGENALIEAMSLGWAPLVFANPAEAAIVKHGITGFVEKDAAAASRRLAWMLTNPEVVAQIGQQAAADIAVTRSPDHLARTFERVYQRVLAQKKRRVEFGAILGETPADWFLSTQCLDVRTRSSVQFSTSMTASKGSFSHYLDCFPDDPSLLALVRERSGRSEKIPAHRPRWGDDPGKTKATTPANTERNGTTVQIHRSRKARAN